MHHGHNGPADRAALSRGRLVGTEWRSSRE